jgi:lipopolysaccharide/colanic/teichoic acid biosynthesis glycosyltransferase
MKNKFYHLYGKRLFDLFLILPGIVVLSPFLIIISIGIVIFDGFPVFFTQSRVGKEFSEFKLIKFRSMISDKSGTGSLLTVKNDNRITPIGKFLRRYKFDELPQVVNVLRGEMSIVGPRPEVKKYVNLYQEDYKSILAVRPGLADYATLEFHNEEEVLSQYDDLQEAYINIILPDKIQLYKKYLNDQSLLTDVKIILKTIWNIIG